MRPQEDLQLSQERPLILVLAPRHFEKADAVEANVRKAGFDCVRRSRQTTGPCDGRDALHGGRHGGHPSPRADGRDALRRVRGGIGDAALPVWRDDRTTFNGRGASPMRPQGTSQPPVFLADTTGELMGLYGIADVVFVGKSLCAHGSQNMIEPCLCGKPTLVGPYTENFRPVMSDLLAADAIVQVRDAAELEKRMGDMIELGNGDCLGARAQAAVARRRGVVAKCVAEIRNSL